MKMAVSWNLAPYILAIRTLMMKDVSTSETLVNCYHPHVTTSQKIATFRRSKTSLNPF
jgi:hypothetical protein